MSETKSKPYNVSISVAGSNVVYRFNDKQQIVGVDERTSQGVVKPIVPNSADFNTALESDDATYAFYVNKYKGDKDSYKGGLEKASDEEITNSYNKRKKAFDNAGYIDNDFSVPASPKYAKGQTTYDYGENKSTKFFAYPLDINLNQDHLKITRYKYRRETLNASFPTGTQEKDEETGEMVDIKGGTVLGDLIGSIILPMPKATDTNGAEWGKNELNAQGLAALGIANAITGMPASTEAERMERNEAFRQFQEQRGDNEFGNAFKQGSGAIYNQIVAKTAGMLLGTELNADTVLARKGGVVLNPNAEMLFQGPVLRDFSFKYRMVARSKKEGIAIRSIIKFLKSGMAPKFRSSTYLKSPDVFTLEYKNGPNGLDILKTVNRFSPGGLALTTLGTDYAPNTYWSAYDDSQPVEITMDLSFAELRPIYEQDQMDLKGDNVGY
tara:strand:+ start:80 stop:1399 length:1320 start_codon:yes stop_codon:yes gene_type:complete